MNKGENIILFNQFNNVLSLCLSDIVTQINFSFTSDKLKEKMTSNTSFEETFLDICKVTFNDCINEQFDKFKSMPIVKISPSPSLFNGIKLIFRKCLDLLCENIQSSIDKKTKIINDISKIDYSIPNKLDGHNIEQLLYKLSNFINENILTPLFEPNNNKIQNNDKILQILKSKICEKIQAISPLIQGQINKLIEDNNKLDIEFKNFKAKYLKEMEQKNDEISNLKLKAEKQDRSMKEKELENMTLINIEKEKYNQLEEKYNLEINEKNSHIRELTKHSNSLNPLANITGAIQEGNLETMQLESLKNEYNDITDILVKYKILVSKLINDKDFFFEDILIDKTIGDLRKKYPEIFGLLSEKETLENMKSYYDKQVEILKNEKDNLKEKINSQLREIDELKEKLEDALKEKDDKMIIIDSQYSIIKNKDTLISGLENSVKEFDIKMKGKIKLIQEKYVNEIENLLAVIDAIFSKQKSRFNEAFLKLSTEYQEKLKQGASNYNKMK